MLWDAHCHLYDTRITDLYQQLEEARQAHIQKWVVCSTGPENWDEVLSLTKHTPCFFPAFGVHPWYLDNLPPDWDTRLFEILKNTPSFVGECGLDFEKPFPELQENVFSQQIAIAQELGLPLNIHCRKAWHRLWPLLKPAQNKIPGFIIHAYSQNKDIAKQIYTSGGFVSFASHILRPWNSNRYHKLIADIPLEAILIETDAPDIPLYTPETGLSQLSRLSHLTLVASQICEWKNISYDRLSEHLDRVWKTLTSPFSRKR
ncbi:MAG: TatD family hydrolase [Brevinematales bacterium]|nr:TatD family hydrolase [Brevinematales bacterium]